MKTNVAPWFAHCTPTRCPSHRTRSQTWISEASKGLRARTRARRRLPTTVSFEALSVPPKNILSSLMHLPIDPSPRLLGSFFVPQRQHLLSMKSHSTAERGFSGDAFARTLLLCHKNCVCWRLVATNLGAPAVFCRVAPLPINEREMVPTDVTSRRLPWMSRCLWLGCLRCFGPSSLVPFSPLGFSRLSSIRRFLARRICV